MSLKLCISLQSYATAFVSLFTNRVKPIAKAMATTPKTASLAADTKGLLIGSVTIASYSSIATHWLPEVISRFQSDYPQIKITMLEGCRTEVVKWLDDKLADVAFMSYREPFPYDWIPLFDEFGIEPDIRFSTVESFSALQMVEKGLGISIMNELITRNWPCEIVKLPISPPRSISFGIALNYLRHSSPAVKRFVKYSESIIKKKNK